MRHLTLIGAGIVFGGIVGYLAGYAVPKDEDANPRIVSTATPTLTASPVMSTSPEEPAPTSDEDEIVRVARARAEAVVGSKPGMYEIKIVKRSGNFVIVNVGSSQGGVGGYAIYLKKGGTTWVPIFDGQRFPDNATVQKYGIPADLQNP